MSTTEPRTTSDASTSGPDRFAELRRHNEYHARIASLMDPKRPEPTKIARVIRAQRERQRRHGG